MAVIRPRCMSPQTLFSMSAHSGMIPETGEEDVRVDLPTLTDSQRQWRFDEDGMSVW